MNSTRVGRYWSPERIPQLRSQIIHWLAARGAKPDLLLTHLFEAQPQGSELQGVLLALGEFRPDEFKSADFEQLVELLQRYVGSNYATIKTAAQWLLKEYGKNEEVDAIVAEELNQRRQILATFKAKTEAIIRDPQEDQKREQWFATILEQFENSNQSPSDIEQLIPTFEWPLISKAEIADETEIFANGTPVSVTDSPFGGAVAFHDATIATLKGDNFPNDITTFSISCWFKTETAQWAAIVSKMDPDSLRGFDLWLDDGRIGAHIKNTWEGVDQSSNRYIKVFGPQRVSDGKWHHVTATYDGSGRASGLKLFLDGKRLIMVEAFDTLSGGFENDAPLLVGGRSKDCTYNGEICCLKFYDRCLTADETKNLFLADLKPLLLVDGQPRQPAELNDEETEILTRAFDAARQLDSRQLAQLDELAKQQTEMITQLERRLVLHVATDS